MALRVAARCAITSVFKHPKYTVSRTVVQRKTASPRPVSRAGALVEFVNPRLRTEAHATVKYRAQRLVQQGIGVTRAVSEAHASLGPYIVDTLRRSDTLTPSKACYDRLRKRKLKQHASNTGHAITGTKLMGWSEKLRIQAKAKVQVIHSTTVRLSRKIEADALAQEQPCNWLRKRFIRISKKALGYAPAGIFATGIVSDGGDALHIHALLAVSLDDLDALKLALHEAGGKVEEAFREYQVDVRPAYSACVLEYIAKNAEEEGSAGRVHGRTVVISGLRKQRTASEKVEDKSNLTYHSDETSGEAEIGVDVCPSRTQGVTSNNADEGRELADAAPNARRDLRKTDRRPHVRRVHAPWDARVGRAQRPHDRAWRARQRLPGPDPPARGDPGMSVAWHVANKPSESADFEVWRAYFRDCPYTEFEMCVAGILVEHGARLHLPEGETPFYNFEYRFSDGPFSSYNTPNPFDLTSRLGREISAPVLRAMTENLTWGVPEDRNLQVWIYSVLRNSNVSLIAPDKLDDLAKLPAEIKIYRHIGLPTQTVYGSPTSSIFNLDNAVRGFHWSLSPTAATHYGGRAREGWRKFCARAVIARAAITCWPFSPDEEVVIGRPDLIPADRIELTEIRPDPRDSSDEFGENAQTISDRLMHPIATTLQPKRMLASIELVDRPRRPVLVGALGDPRLLLQPRLFDRF
ncbi:hypothetical protein ACLNGM_11265 [Aureimonas phyllosphaerae]|uniref:hypothetical protein n=1 Tax=Aureimonas phyllosphaerae TaxID=1166078 RepID=UPI003A5BA1E8